MKTPLKLFIATTLSATSLRLGPLLKNNKKSMLFFHDIDLFCLVILLLRSLTFEKLTLKTGW